MCVRCAAAKEKSLKSKSKSKWIINMCTVANWPPYTAADTIPPFYCRHSLFSPSFVCLFWNGSPMRELHYLTACITNVFFLAQHANKQCDLINAKKRDSQNLKNVRFQPPVKRKYFYARYSVCTFNFTKNPLNWKMNRAKSHTRTQRRRPLSDTYTM